MDREWAKHGQGMGGAGQKMADYGLLREHGKVWTENGQSMAEYEQGMGGAWAMDRG